MIVEVAGVLAFYEVVDIGSPSLIVLVLAADPVEASILDQPGSGLVETKGNVVCDTLVAQTQHPVEIAWPGLRARLSTHRNLLNLLRKVGV